ncbi:O-acetylserine/cysteine efflux transporter [Anaerosolibacter carboniphilus]|uniref:O-acetylserine/cysteine efflux transporter n=1 Tax=Anaerosolibacter carboniphilus TaxID=1417629 RepID=A0A841L3Z9_9FIRM|nr:EamA family transporter [Anaerosolibacter carboniphilus]MBB6217852.1 O-acetylserine/cysteine efflux transporter [Anaerosolibacter carboniphilus]
MNRRDIGIGFIVAILWGLNFIAIKMGVANMPPLLLATIRFVVLCIPAIFFLPRPPVDWRWLIALGLTLNVGQFAFLFMGVKLGMPAGLSSLVHQSQAFFTLVIAALLIGERWHWNHVVGLMIAAVGMVVVGSQQGGSMTAAGFWLTLAASASWGTGNVIMRRATQGVPPFSMVSLVVWAGAVAIFPLAFLSLCIEGLGAWQAAWHSVNWVTVVSVIYLAYFASLGGYGLWGKLLSRYPAAVVSPFALLVPIIGMSSAVLFLRETFSLWQIMGALLVMIGLVVNVFGGRLEKSIEKKQV